MLLNIKSLYLFNNILKHVKNKIKLNIIRYNKLYQSKLKIDKNDYLYEFISKLSFDSNTFVQGYPNEINYDILYKNLKKNISNKFPNDILKQNIIKYFSINDELYLSINHIFLNEILREKISLGKKNLKIIIEFKKNFSQSDIINLIDSKSTKLFKYISDNVDFYNKIIQKLENLLKTDIPITNLIFNVYNDISHLYIDHQKDIIEYKSNETSEEKNILINFKSKRAEIINKILEKNCKNIVELKYIVFEKNTSEEIKPIFPSIELDKFENLGFLDLYILYKDEYDKEISFNFTDKLNKLKELKINGYGITSKRTINYILNICIPKNILDNLENLKIKDAQWWIKENEFYNLINIKKLHLDNCFLPEKYNIQKKYFFDEFLKGNIHLENLKEFKISLLFDSIPELKKDYINKEIINFIKVANNRENYEKSTSEFFPIFFKFIFENQLLAIKTNENNKDIENFMIEIYDNEGCDSCEKKKVSYNKKRKNVNITIEGILYGEVFLNPYLQESPLKYIDLDKLIIDSCLDSFTIDNLSLEQLKQIKLFSLEHFKKIENLEYFFNNIVKYNNNELENEENELKLRQQFLEDEIEIIKLYNSIDYVKEKYYEIKLYSVKELAYFHEKDIIEKILKKIKKIMKKKPIIINSNYNQNQEEEIYIDNLADIFG